MSLDVLQEEDGLEEDPFAGIGEDPLALDEVKQEPMDIQVSLSLSLLSHSLFSPREEQTKGFSYSSGLNIIKFS